MVSNKHQDSRPKDTFSFKRIFGSKSKQQPQKLSTTTSSTSSSETVVPSDWKSWQDKYRDGEFDFDNPPAPPTSWKDAPHELRSPMGSYIAPKPANEHSRQRALNALQAFDSSSRRTSTTSNVPSVSSSATGTTASSITTPAPSTIDHKASAKAAAPSLKLPPELKPVFDNLVQQATQEFGMPLSMVALVDEQDLYFLAEKGLDANTFPRTDSLCSHSVLKATHHENDGLVVRDLDKDWRFKNVFPFKFYASAPISAPAAFGDDQLGKEYPCGTFCLMDMAPRAAWNEAQQDRLKYYAKQASLELKKWKEAQEEREEEAKAKQHEAFVKVAEIDSLAQATDELSVSTGDKPSRPALHRVRTAESRTSDIATTSVTPTFARRTRRPGVHAATVPRMPPSTKSVIDLSTKLLGETLDLDFTYLVAVSLPGRSNGAEAEIRLLSSHNTPIPAPLFDHGMHLETLVSENNALLLVNPDSTGQDGDYSTGLLVKVLVADDVGYVLGGFSESKRRVLNKSDFLFFRRFASDMQKFVKEVNDKVDVLGRT